MRLMLMTVLCVLGCTTAERQCPAVEPCGLCDYQDLELEAAEQRLGDCLDRLSQSELQRAGCEKLHAKKVHQKKQTKKRK